MELVLVGLNHASAPIRVREAFHMGKQAGETLLTRLRFERGAAEGVLLATCNRVEAYAVGVDPHTVADLLARQAGFELSAVRHHFYFKVGNDVAEHLFHVAAGLDSIVLGEDQILGQVAQALRLAQGCRASGRVLNSLFLLAVACGKRVRNETALGEGAFSVGRVAVDLAKQRLGSLTDRGVLIVGAGKISEVSAKHMASHGVKPILVANRTHEHAAELAQKIGGEAVFFEDIRSRIADIDILVSSTSAPHYVIHADLIRCAMRDRPQRPMLLIDLAVPRDIDPGVLDVPGATLVNIDDLKSIKEESYRRRLDEVPRAEAIVEEACGRWRLQRAGLEASGVISALREKCEGIRKAELAKISHVLATLNDAQREAVEVAAQAMMNKFLHEPTVQLKEMHMREQEILPVVCDLFRLPAGRCRATNSKEALVKAATAPVEECFFPISHEVN